MNRLLLVTVVLIVIFGSVSADEIHLRSDPWCPYTCDPASDKPGILVEVAQAIFEKAGHTVVYKTMNWARAIQETRKGTFDGLLGPYKSDAPGFIFPEEPVLESRMCFFVKESDPWTYEGYDSLQGRSISVINNYSYGDAFDAYILENRNKGAGTIQTLAGGNAGQRRIKLVALGRIDTILEDWLVFPNQVKARQGMAELKKIKGFRMAGFLSEEGSYIAFSPNKTSSQGYADLVSAGIRQMRQSGELEKIVDKYR
jgi:polar amino acid transport system substrate-binding protein